LSGFMKIRLLVMALLAALVLLVAWFRSPPAAAPSPVAKTTVSANPMETTPPAEQAPAPPPTAAQPTLRKSPAETPASEFRRDFSDPLVPASFPNDRTTASPPSDPATAADLDKITLMFRDYRTITGENPVGTNAEIMKSVMGGNPKGAMLGPPEGQLVNENGELIDRWGTPYFFHQLTKDLMEIHSAGPDRRMWTDDDIVGK